MLVGDNVLCDCVTELYVTEVLALDTAGDSGRSFGTASNEDTHLIW